MNDNKPKVVVILGPTASGKSEAAVKLAGDIDGCIISSDSRQIYKYMDIGTAKPTRELRARVKHYMIDVICPDEEYNAQRYKKEARSIINELVSMGKRIFVVGGTGFYIKALLHGLFEGFGPDRRYRQSLIDEAKKEAHGDRPGEYLYKKLTMADPETAALLHPNDTFRILRALEVYYLSDSPMSAFKKMHSFGDSPYKVLKLGFRHKREYIYQRIESRVDAMLEGGLTDEVRSLMNRGYGLSLRSMQTIGYQQIGMYLSGKLSLDEAIKFIKRDTRRFAKRQLTWFRKDTAIKWYDWPDYEAVRSNVKDFLIDN